MTQGAQATCTGESCEEMREAMGLMLQDREVFQNIGPLAIAA